jgi:hypothetical protein
MSLVTLNIPYFPDPTIGRPVYNGSIYIGDPDTDPEIVGNQKSISIQQEDGTIIPVSQPLTTNAGGLPTYGGETVAVLVDGDYSLKVLNSSGSQVYYVPAIPSGAPIQEDSIYTRTNPGFDLVYPSVSAMKLDASLSPGLIVDTAGYYTEGDGGQDRYLIKTAAQAIIDGDIIDEYGSHTLDNGHVAVLQAAVPTSKQFGSGTSNDTLAVTALFDYAKANAPAEIAIEGLCRVDTIVLADATNIVISGSGSFIGITTTAQDAVLEFKNCVDIDVRKGISVSGSYKTEYTCGVKVWSDSAGTSLNSFEISVAGCAIAWQFGDLAYPDMLCSEMSVSNGYTNGCPIVVKAIGTQTVIEFSQYQMIASYGSGTGSWTSLPMAVATVLGGSVIINGGEQILNTSSVWNCFRVEPINSISYDNYYGHISVSNSEIESASQLAASDNPESIASPIGGLISINQCRGYHAANSFPFIQTDAEFTGDIIVKNSPFHAGVPRTQPNIQADGEAHIYVDDESFGTNFIGGLSGVTGGILHFSRRNILRVRNLAGQSLPNATTTTLIHTVKDTGETLNRFNAQYSTSTGVFTVPVGGLKSVRVDLNMYLAAMTSAGSEIYVQVGATVIGVLSGSKAFGQGAYIGDVVEGTQIYVRFFNISLGAQIATSSAHDCFSITAEN